MNTERLHTVTDHWLFRRLQHHWVTLAFIGGFLLDNITLNRVDQVFDNIVLAFYVVLSMVSLLTLYAGLAGKFNDRLNELARLYAPIAVQFSFGGLLSGMLIFYGRSGDWMQSWPFLLLIIGVIYGNETIKDRSRRLVFNLSIFFVGLFSYVVLLIPVLTGKMGPWVFIGSGLIALLITYAFVQVLFKIIPNFLALHMRSVVFTLGAIFITLNGLNFSNIIPPIPLSLKHVGVYHSVVRFDTGEYQLKYEPAVWWQFWRDANVAYHPRPGDPVFCFAKVFAPTKLVTDIVHVWEYKDTNGDWQEYFRTSYPISGGSDGGYRGYTQVTNYSGGTWRCSVETARGQVIGKRTFEIDTTTPPADLVTRID
jgi:MFS family permease